MINASNNMSGKLATDVKDLSELRLSAKQNSPEALKGAAKQFESLFMNMIMKSMRQATPQDSIFDSEQSKMYTSMLDQQMSQNFANRGVGLADMLIRQLSNRAGPQPVPGAEGKAAAAIDPAAPADKGNAVRHMLDQAALEMGFGSEEITQFNGTHLPLKGERQTVMNNPYGVSASQGSQSLQPSQLSQPSHVKSFQERFASQAEEASRTTGIPAKFMLGQAALETGWGKREIKFSDGSPSNNLFGIKATAGWKGRVVEVPTTEYVNGVPETKMQKFRAYDNYADSFKDYAKLLSNNPRYENVIANAGDAASFARGLQKAGYATDPNYAAKLTRIINHSLLA